MNYILTWAQKQPIFDASSTCVKKEYSSKNHHNQGQNYKIIYFLDQPLSHLSRKD
jgi:hypothetical protein